MRWKLGLALAALATAGLVLVFVALAASDEAAAWRELPAPPLSPRETPTGFWTGEEVVLVGGSDAPPCPPTAACSVPRVAPLADGAAYDPAIGAWRAIADAPVGFSWAEPELIDGSAYLWIAGENGRPNAPSAFLAYRIEEDRWEQLDLPTAAIWVGTKILAAGDRIVAHTYDDSDGERPDYVFETQTSTWRELPDDPFDDPYSRELAWDGRPPAPVRPPREGRGAARRPCAGQPSTSSGTSGSSSMIPRPRSRTCPSARRRRRRRSSRPRQRPTAARPRYWPATTSSSSSARNGASPRAGCTRGPGFGRLTPE